MILLNPPFTPSVFFGTVTGTTQEAANMIIDELFVQGVDCHPEAVCVDDILGSLAPAFAAHDTIICGAPSYHNMRGVADAEQTGTSWDNVLNHDLLCNNECNLDDDAVKRVLRGKRIACFGSGDQVNYPEDFCNAVGELHSVFSSLGAYMFGSMPLDGYSFSKSAAVKESRANRGGRNMESCGLLLDNESQPDLTYARVKAWVKKLVRDGFFAAPDGEQPPGLASAGA